MVSISEISTLMHLEILLQRCSQKVSLLQY